VRGASAVAAQAATFSKLGLSTELVRVNGHLGLLSRRADGRLFSVLGFTFADGKVVEIDILADPERLSRLDLTDIEGGPPEDETGWAAASAENGDSLLQGGSNGTAPRPYVSMEPRRTG